jgi:branched-chain amino acid transport system substrate-binding protein
MRKIFPLAVLLLVLPVAVAAQSAAKPIKVGVLLPLSGPFAPITDSARPGLELAFEEVGYTVAGRPIQLIVEDTETKPDVALTKVKKLVEQDRADVLLGPMSTASALAMKDYLVRKGIPWAVVFGQMEFPRGKAPRNLFQASPQLDQRSYPMGAYLVQKLGHKKAAMVFLDYVAGHTQGRAMIKKFKDAGGQVVAEIPYPLGTADPAPFVSRIQSVAGSIDALAVPAMWGADAIRLAGALKRFGIRDRVPVIAYAAMYGEGPILDAIGKDAALDVTTFGDYLWGIETPENRRFREAYQNKARMPANASAYTGWVTAKAFLEALRAVEGRVEDHAALIDAWSKVAFDGPAGPFQFDENHYVISNFYIGKVGLVDGKLRNLVTDKIVGVRHLYGE